MARQIPHYPDGQQKVRIRIREMIRLFSVYVIVLVRLGEGSKSCEWVRLLEVVIVFDS